MLWAHWEGDNALFHAETGETHLLSALPTLLLEMLAEQRLHTREIYELSAQACGVAVDAAWEQKITAVLRSLEGLELVERFPIASA
jgi:PqqD family protein of HPr-rel-A system